ncbi:MAG: FkbM family methyltransferase, partial [Saprospiraceae bacterium]
MREFLKKIVHIWPWPLTTNERYDRQTKAILEKVCARNSVCIDVGCFRGEILESMMKYAPDAHHIAFEPIPEHFIFLEERFGKQATIYPYALGNENKESTFNHVVSNPTYSGLKQRAYKGEETINEIIVPVRRLDDIVSINTPIRVIKIDVEGGEYGVLKCAENMLKKWHPYIIFEHGLGGADRYGITPSDVYAFLVDECGYKLGLMGDYLKNENLSCFTKQEFGK